MGQVILFIIGCFFGYIVSKLTQKKEVSRSNGTDSTENPPSSGGHPDPDKEEK